jgi:hypothetical protein
MAYADDELLSARTKAVPSAALQEFEGAARNIGLRISEEKTEYMKTTRNQDITERIFNWWSINSLPAKASNTWEQ